MIPRLFLISLILFFIELGVFLLLLPWTVLWEGNYFLFRYPQLAPWLLNHYLRGALSGLGLVNLGLAVWYAAHFRDILKRLLESSAVPPARESVNRGQTA